MISGVLLLGLTSISATATTQFVMPDAQWKAMCPAIFGDADLRKRNLPFNAPIKHVDPVYPEMEEDREGSVVLDARIATDGRVVDARVAAVSDPIFSESALAAVKGWQFAAPIVDGKPACLVIPITIRYELAP